MKNKLSDLNDHLFAQMERLGDETLKGEKLDKEIQRTDALTKTAKTIIDNASLVLQATKVQAELPQLMQGGMPTMLSNKQND